MPNNFTFTVTFHCDMPNKINSFSFARFFCSSQAIATKFYYLCIDLETGSD